jgi:hypothetical protein
VSIEGLTPEHLAAEFRAVADLVHDVENPAPGATTQPGRKTRGAPGSQVPPGMQAILDEDATQRALMAAYELSAYVAKVIVERCNEVLRPSSLDGAQVLVDMTYDAEGRYIVYGILDDLRATREALGSVVRRYERVVQTGRPCFDYACSGHYLVPAQDGSLLVPLVCSDCRDVISYETWREWDIVTPDWVSPEEAGRILGDIAYATVRQRASRGKWKRRGHGRTVRYWTEDVRREKARVSNHTTVVPVV